MSQQQQYQAPLEQQPQQQEPAPQPAPSGQQQSGTRGPEDTLRDGRNKATIWRNEGKDRDYFTTDFAQTYKDEDGKLKDKHNFGEKDLLSIAELARQAHHRVKELRREAYKERRQDTSQQGRSGRGR